MAILARTVGKYIFVSPHCLHYSKESRWSQRYAQCCNFESKVQKRSQMRTMGMIKHKFFGNTDFYNDYDYVGDWYGR